MKCNTFKASSLRCFILKCYVWLSTRPMGLKCLQLYDSLFNKLVFNKDNKQILPKLKHIAQSRFVDYYASYYLWNITPSKNI